MRWDYCCRFAGTGFVVCMLLTLMPSARGDDPPMSTPRVQNVHDAAVLAARIDELIAQRWDQRQVRPAPPVDDAGFLRRTHLDLAGKIPPASEARAFLNDASPNKRQVLVERLLGSPNYVVHFTNVWRKVLLSEAESSEFRNTIPFFEVWLRKQLAENVSYDRMVHAILTVSLEGGQQQIYNRDDTAEPTPFAFYQAKEMKPENLAAATARLFMGVRVECAQCHDHPAARWKQKDFWSHAAFFAGAEPRQAGGLLGTLRQIFDRRELTMPGTNEIVQARYIDGGEPAWKFQVPARNTLADWLTARENPYFARAAVNRLWAYFLGTGLVDPLDDFDEHNAPSHPELLAELTRQFVDHSFDLKFLIRSITATRCYQLSSRQRSAGGSPAQTGEPPVLRVTGPAQEEPHDYAVMPLRAMSPEQLFDSLSQATGFQDASDKNRNPFAFANNSPRSEFLERFSEQGQTPVARQTSILQALALMNGRVTTSATDLRTSETLAAVAECPLFDTPARIEALYLSTLTRRPSAQEQTRLTAYIASGGPRKDASEALADVFWALLNSSEFMLNH